MLQIKLLQKSMIQIYFVLSILGPDVLLVVLIKFQLLIELKFRESEVHKAFTSWAIRMCMNSSYNYPYHINSNLD